MSTKKIGWAGHLLAALVLTAAASAAQADIINVGSGDWTGERSTGDGIDNNDWDGDITVEWTITYDSNSNEFTYVYVVSGTESPAVSHFDIEVSENFDEDDILDGSVTNVGDGITLGDRQSWGSGGLGNDAPVLKFDWGEGDDGDQQGTPWEVTYTLVTEKRPVWGDILLKGAGDLAVNTGFDTDPTSGTTDFTDWVPTPDSVNMVPLPPAAWMGLGLLGVLGLARRRRQRRDS